MRNRCRQSGFTLAETLAASTILCGAVMTIAAVSTQTMRITKENRQYETAMLLLDKQLCMIDYIGIDDFAEAGPLSGAFEGYSMPYQWTILTEYTGIDSLYVVQVEVTWPGKTGILRVSAQTMLNGETLLEEGEAGGGTIGEEGSIIRGGGGGGGQ